MLKKASFDDYVKAHKQRDEDIERANHMAKFGEAEFEEECSKIKSYLVKQRLAAPFGYTYADEKDLFYLVSSEDESIKMELFCNDKFLQIRYSMLGDKALAYQFLPRHVMLDKSNHEFRWLESKNGEAFTTDELKESLLVHFQEIHEALQDR